MSPPYTCQNEITHFLDIFVETEFKLQVCLGHSPWQCLTDNGGITVARRSAVIFHPPCWCRGRSIFLKSRSGLRSWHASNDRKSGQLLWLRSFWKTGWYPGTFCSSRLITPGRVFMYTDKSHHSRRDSQRPCPSLPEVPSACLRSGRWKSAPFSQSTQFTDQTIDRQAS